MNPIVKKLINFCSTDVLVNGFFNVLSHKYFNSNRAKILLSRCLCEEASRRPFETHIVVDNGICENNCRAATK